MCYLLQDIYDLIPRTSSYPPCCNFFCQWGLKVLVLSSSNFWACATASRLGWHAHPGNGSADKSNHITTSPETRADCLNIVLGLTESMGQGSRCAAHKAPAIKAHVATQNRQMCCSQSTSTPSPYGHKHKTKLLKGKTLKIIKNINIIQVKKQIYKYYYI